MYISIYSIVHQDRLLNAMEPVMEKMAPHEKARNKHGPHLLYVYVPDEIEPFRSQMPDKFPDIIHNHAMYVNI